MSLQDLVNTPWNTPGTNDAYYIQSRDMTEQVAPVTQSGGWLDGALKGLINTTVGAGNAAINAWASGQVNKATAERNDRLQTAGTTTPQNSFFGGLTKTTGTGVVMIIAGVAGLIGLVALLRK